MDAAMPKQLLKKCCHPLALAPMCHVMLVFILLLIVQLERTDVATHDFSQRTTPDVICRQQNAIKS
eukprot:1536756-Amphidinium_carterae.1